MATNLTTARAMLLARAGFNAQDQSTQNTELDYALNEGLNAYASEHDWWWLHDVDSITTVAGQSAYAMPADYKNTLTVWTGDNQIYPRQFQDLIRLEDETSGVPFYYTIHDEQLHLSPAPSTAGDTVYHLYVRRESTLTTGTDTPLIPDRYVPLWLSYAAIWLFNRNGNAQNVAIHTRDKDTWLRRARDEARAQRGFPPVRARRDVIWNA